VDGQTASRITVVVNEQDFASSSEAGARPQSIRVEKIIMHQNYNNKNIDNDIAVNCFLYFTFQLFFSA